MPICQCVCVKSIAILNWSFCLAGLFFSKPLTKLLKIYKYRMLWTFTPKLPGLSHSLPHLDTFGEYDFRTPLKKHQLSNCCRMAEQHHHMTKKVLQHSSDDHTLHGILLPKDCHIGLKKIKKLKTSRQCGQTSASKLHETIIMLWIYTTSCFILSGWSDVLSRVFFFQTNKDNCASRAMKVSDSQNSWKLIAIEFWSCYSLRVLSSTVLQHITLVRRRHYQTELMTGGNFMEFPWNFRSNLWFQKSPNKNGLEKKQKTGSKLLTRGSLKSRKTTWKTDRLVVSTQLEKYQSNWILSPNRGEHKKIFETTNQLRVDTPNTIADETRWSSHQFPPNFSKIGLRLRSWQTVATPEKKWGRSAAS